MSESLCTCAYDLQKTLCILGKLRSQTLGEVILNVIIVPVVLPLLDVLGILVVGAPGAGLELLEGVVFLDGLGARGGLGLGAVGGGGLGGVVLLLFLGAHGFRVECVILGGYR
uniref:Uncharacterized protein n=1 Tax=Minutocellus polymorphus TaxID=265543 RepID=A0A7S0B281_9STRA